MPISSLQRKVGPTPGNGVATDFPFAFKVFAPSDLQVVRTSANGGDTTLTLASDYLVILNADQDEDPGGLVRLPQALPAGMGLTIISAVPLLQPTDWQNQGRFLPETLNESLDRGVAGVQQLAERLGRAIVAPSTVGQLTMVKPLGNRLLGWNEDGTQIINYDPADIIGLVAYGETVTDTFTGDGVETVFDLSFSAGAESNVFVAMGGVVQTPGEDYTWLGSNQIEFAEPPADGIKFMARYQRALEDAGGQMMTDGSNAAPTFAANAGVVSSAALALPNGADLIGMIRNEAGAIRRSVRDALLDRVSVRDFGAVGDGVGRFLQNVTSHGDDDTTGWSLAQWQTKYPFATSLTNYLDWCAFQAAANTGKLVDVPSGSYVIGPDKVAVTSVSGSNGATFQGDGFSSTYVTFTGTSGDCFNFTTCSGAGIHDMTLRCSQTRVSDAAVRFVDSNDLRSFGMRFQSIGTGKFYASYILDGGANQFLYHIDGYQISGGVWGIIVGSTANLVQDTWIGKGVVNNCDESGVDLRDCSGVFIYGWPDFLACKHGLKTNPASGRIVTAVLVSGMLADTCDLHGIYLTTNGGSVSNVTLNAWSASNGTLGGDFTSSLCSGLCIEQGSGKIDGVTVQGQYYNNITSGIALISGTDIHIENAQIGYNSRGTSNLFAGVYFGAGAVDCSMTGGRSGRYGLFRARDNIATFQSYGVQIDVGALRTHLSGVNVRANVTAGVKNDGTGSVISECEGYRTKANFVWLIPSGATTATVTVPLDAPLNKDRVTTSVSGPRFAWCSSVSGQDATFTTDVAGGDLYFIVSVDQSF